MKHSVLISWMLMLLMMTPTEAEDFAYLTNSGTVTIVGYNGPSGDVTIPDHVGDLPVTGIANSAFHAYLPVTVPSISIPNTVTNIEVFAFTGCPGLTAFNVEAQNPAYAALDGVLFDKDLKTLVVFPSARAGTYNPPGGVLSIGEGAFAGCQLVDFIVPGSVTNIGGWAFAECSLTNVTIGENVAGIGSDAFLSDLELKTIRLQPGNLFFSEIDGVLFDKDEKTLIAFPGGRLGSYVVPESVVRISDQAFYASRIANLAISSSVTNIGMNAFYRSGLTNLVISGGDIEIGGWAFALCEGLRFVFITGSSVCIRGDAFVNCSALTNLTLGDGVVSIESYAFAYCYSLTNVIIPGSVTNIASRAFYRCARLSGIHVDTQSLFYASVGGVLFDKNLKVLLAYPARSRPYFSNYTIPDGVTCIGDSAFAECPIYSVTFPHSVTNIGQYAFYRSHLSIAGLGNDVKAIGDYAFYECEFSYINLPGVTSIGAWAFSYSALKAISIPNTTTNIGAYAFYGCAGLATVNIPTSIGKISEGVFSSCSQLSGISIPSSVTSIGHGAFHGAGLTNIFIPGSVTNIETGALGNCRNMTEIMVEPSNLFYTRVDGILFDKNLTTLIQFPGGKSGGYTIPGGVRSVGYEAFFNCAGLTNVTISATVTNLAEYAFGFCRNLASIYFEGDAPALGRNVFYGSQGAIGYYLPWADGWDVPFDALPTTLWKPYIQVADAGFGVRSNVFQFNIAWASGTTVVIEACTNLAGSEWVAVGTNVVLGGSSSFQEPFWTNKPLHIYRVRGY